MRILSAVSGFVLIAGLVACSSQDQEKAREQAREDVRKAAIEAKKAGKELKADAQDLNRKIGTVAQPDTEPAASKISRAGVKLDHAALLAKVKTKLVSDAGLATLTGVEVAADGGVVTLSGTVANEHQKEAAGLAASQVDGVTRVQNRLAVQP